MCLSAVLHVYCFTYCFRKSVKFNKWNLRNPPYFRCIYLKIFINIMWHVSYITFLPSVILCVECELCMKTAGWNTDNLCSFNYHGTYKGVLGHDVTPAHICWVLMPFYFLLKHIILEVRSFCNIKDLAQSNGSIGIDYMFFSYLITEG
jgi:hypothetical protein